METTPNAAKPATPPTPVLGAGTASIAATSEAGIDLAKLAPSAEGDLNALSVGSVVTAPDGYLLHPRYAELADLTYTGIVEPAPVFVLDETTGKRRRSNQQAVNADDIHEWEVNINRLGTNYGRPADLSSKVVVPSRTAPRVIRHQRAEFVDLTLRVRVTRDGDLVESFSASGIKQGGGAK